MRSSATEVQCKRNFIQNDFTTKKIVNGGGNFVLNEVAETEHTKRYVSISPSEEQCKRNFIQDDFTTQKIVNDEIIFVPSEETNPEHSRTM